MIARKIISIGFIVCMGSVVHALDRNEFCSKLLNDIAQGQPVEESLWLAAQHKEVILHKYQGKPLFVHIAEKYAKASSDVQRYEQQLEANPNNEQAASNLMKVSSQLDPLQQVGRRLVTLGKGYGPFEAEINRLMDYFKGVRGRNSFGIVVLQEAFPDTFPEEVEEAAEEVVPDDVQDEEEEPFEYVQPSEDLAYTALRFEAAVRYINAERYHFSMNSIGDDLYAVSDLSGKTIVRYLAEKWFAEKYPNNISYNGLFLSYHRYNYTNPEAHREFFEKMLEKIKNNRMGIRQLDDLMQCFSTNEDGYAPLITIYDDQLSNVFGSYKNWRPPDVPLEPATVEKTSAFMMAKLIDVLLDGDVQLSNAFKMVQENPSLVHVCDPSGLTLLHLVMRKYDNAYCVEQQKMLGLFFDYLLLNGADYKKKTRVKDRFTDRLITLPTIEELVDGREDVGIAIPAKHPRCGHGAHAHKISIYQTSHFFKQKLDAFILGKTAQFEGSEGAWLKERMPVKPEPAAAPVRPQKNEQQDKDIDELLKQYQQQDTKSTWEAWKPTLKYFVTGAVVGGIGYWLWNNSWGDHHEKMRQERDRIRLMAARAS